jgi:hypothetical protein
LSLQEGKKKFLILRKNFRGITFFALSKTPISVIKKSFSTQRKTTLKSMKMQKKYFPFFEKIKRYN